VLLIGKASWWRNMQATDRAGQLSHIPIFARLPRSELQHLAETLRALEFPEQAVLVREGSRDDRLYIVLEGQIEVIKALGTADERVVAQRDEGALLGEMSLFSRNGSHTASVRAMTPVDLLEMTRDDLDALLHRHPKFAYELVGLLSRRLEESEDTTILDLREKNRQLTEAYRELKAAQAQIIEKERLERELEIAQHIQASILPQDLPTDPVFDFGARIVPARMVGGDFYDLFSVGEGCWGIVVGDVCDKGVPAALFMMLTYSLMRAEAPRASSPGEALLAVNRHLLDLNPSGMFVTLLYGVLDAHACRLTYARAGHPPPLLLDGAGRPVTVAVGVGQPLGLFDTPVLDEQDLIIPSRGTTLVFSDGLSDVLEDPSEDHAWDRLCSAVAAIPDATAQGICNRLWEEAQAAGADPQVQMDDFVLVTIKRRG
jgi:sigma-B regulation protein RsbU (phosphoserine phosphatase)